uniref:Uncharacterized protein n=1 Tax=Meloidogyne floridensis TaxID=298350 RepID=A0A915P171_9BILA
MNLKINIYLFLILFINLINSNNIQNNSNILVEYTKENNKQIKINLINIEFIKNNVEERLEYVNIKIEINGMLSETDKIYLASTKNCNYGVSENNKIYTKKDIINLNKNKKIIYLNEKELVKIKPIFYGLIEINIRDENGNYLNQTQVSQGYILGYLNIKNIIKLNGIEAKLEDENNEGENDGDMFIVEQEELNNYSKYIYRADIQPIFELKNGEKKK